MAGARSQLWPFLLRALPVVGIFLCGLLLRLTQLDAHGLWYDEVISVQSAQDGIGAIFAHRFGTLGNQTPWHYLLLWPFVQIADPALTSALVRLPSALAGALTVPVVYALGRALFDRNVGLLASALVALSPLLLDFSLDARPYGMLAFLSVLSVYCLVRATRTGAWRWWLAFSLAAVANLLNSYTAVTLFLPPIGLALVAMIAQGWWAHRKGAPWRTAPILVSGGVIGVMALLTWLDLTRVPRTSPLGGLFSLDVVGHVVSTELGILTSLSPFGLPGGVERVAQFVLLVLAAFGAYGAWRAGHRPGAALCSCFVLIPTFELSILSIHNTIYQRYIIFSAPFYFLLIVYALVNLAVGFSLRIAGARGVATERLSVPWLLSLASIVICLLCFLVGAINYVNPSTHDSLSYRPDFRGAAAYLTREVDRTDVIVFADDPALGYTVTDFYWHSNPPAPAFDARDPRLFSTEASGHVYWVVSSLNPAIVPRLSSGQTPLHAVAAFEGVVVLKEDLHGSGIVAAFDRVVRALDGLNPSYQPFVALRGVLSEAQGDIKSAVASYEVAGTYFPLSDELLRTADGFESLGDVHRAWREAVLARFMEPQLPGPHIWFTSRLAQEGCRTEGLYEEMVASALDTRSP